MKQIGAFLRSAFLVLVAVAATLFVMQNLAPMEVHFLAWSLRAPAFVCVLISLLLGGCAGWIMGAWPKKKKPPPIERPQPTQSEHQ
jgi:uncharacterized integral membrane protein